MDRGWSLAGVFALSIGTGVWELYRHRASDALSAVLLGELGVVLGVIVDAVLPGGILVGLVGGIALAARRLDTVRSRRGAALNAIVDGAGSKAELRLALQDRADALSESVGSKVRFAEALAVAILVVAAVWIFLVGAFSHSGTACVVGGGLAFLPAAAVAQRRLAGQELEEVSRSLARIDDPWPGQEQAMELRGADGG